MVRNGFIADETSEMIISVWGDLINEIQEYKWYTFTDVTFKHFYGRKLTANMETCIHEFQTALVIEWANIDVEMYAQREQIALEDANPTICCPDIESAEVNIYPVCKNPNCLSKVEFQPGDQFVKCVKCSRRMLLEKCLSGFTAMLDLCKENVVKSLSIQPNVLSLFFDPDIIQKYKDNTSALEEKLLLLENIDFTHNTKNIITSIKKHLKEHDVEKKTTKAKEDAEPKQVKDDCAEEEGNLGRFIQIETK
eukprot:gene13177-14527_t